MYIQKYQQASAITFLPMDLIATPYWTVIPEHGYV